MPQNFYSSLEPLITIFRFLGLAPFEFNPKKNKFKSSSKLKRYSVFVLVIIPLIGIAAYLIKTRLTNIPSKVKSLLHIAETVNQTFMYVTFTTFVFSLMWYQHKTVAVLNSLLDIDKTLLECPRVLYRQTKHRVSLGLSLVFMILGILEVFDFMTNMVRIGIQEAVMLLLVNFIFPFVTFGNLQFMNLLLLIRKRIVIINSEIEDIAKTTMTSNSDYNCVHLDKSRHQPSRLSTRKHKQYTHGLQFAAPRKIATVESIITETFITVQEGNQGIVKRIQNLRKNHFRLFRIVLITNDINGIPLLLTLISSLTNVVVNTHVFVRYVSMADDEVVLLAAWAKMLWATGYALLAFQLTLVCYKTGQDYSNTAFLIQDILYNGRRVNKALEKEFRSFLGQISNAGLSFSANGFCDIDFGLLCGMAGAVVTYLMVLFQIN